MLLVFVSGVLLVAELAEAEATAHEDVIALVNNLQAQQSGIDQQWSQLEQERKAIAAQRIRDP